MSKVKLMILTGVVTILTFVATISAASASAWIHYQPQLPKSLQK